MDAQIFAIKFILQNFGLFRPNSAGRPDQLAIATVEAINQFVPSISSLLETVYEGRRISVLNSKDWWSDFGMQEGLSTSESLQPYFLKYGSDKSSVHDYHKIYDVVCNNFGGKPVNLLEIGMGSNNPQVMSNMGSSGKPGGSLRAFRNFLPRGSNIFGADIDEDILFEDGSIRTFSVDQTSKQSLVRLFSLIDREIDIFIDDGLHSPTANIITLSVALKFLRKGGFAIVEDIDRSKRPIWEVVSLLLPDRFQSAIVECKAADAFVVKFNGE